MKAVGREEFLASIADMRANIAYVQMLTVGVEDCADIATAIAAVGAFIRVFPEEDLLVLLTKVRAVASATMLITSLTVAHILEAIKAKWVPLVAPAARTT